MNNRLHCLQRQLATLIVLFSTITIWAQAPTGYYSTADGKVGYELKTSLFKIIKDHTTLSYGDLWTAYETTDMNADGKIWDMYSDGAGYEYTYKVGQCGNYKEESDCYNREHSFPKSWFNDAAPMYTDLFHIYPTDGYVNGRRSNYPFGDVGTAKYSSLNGSKLGTCSDTGYSGTVFEPIDEYKGDFARTYFYMATCYQDKVSSWTSNGEAANILDGSSTQVYKDWYVNVLLQWNELDPVSEKEIARNNAVYKIQGNRNPFIDNPSYVTSIWSKSTDGGNDGNDSNENEGEGNETATCLIDETLCSSFGVFTAYSIEGSQKWTSDKQYGAKMSGYVSKKSYANEDWLVSTPISLSAGNIDAVHLSFEHVVNFDLINTKYKILVSTNYTSGDPTAAGTTWTDISDRFTWPTTGSYTYIENTDIDLSDFIGNKNVSLAFCYTCGTQSSGTWEIRNLSLCTSKASGVDNIEDENAINIFPNPVADIINVDSQLDIKSISIYNTAGMVVETAKEVNYISAQRLNKGLYFVVVELVDGQTISKKIVKQ